MVSGNSALTGLLMNCNIVQDIKRKRLPIDLAHELLSDFRWACHFEKRKVKRERFTDEQLIGMLKEEESDQNRTDTCRKHWISDTTF